MSEREQLTEFYKSLKTRAPADVTDFDDLVGPDLIWVDDEYLKSNPRIAVVGQQQLGGDYTYADFLSKWRVEDAITSQRKFDFGLDYYASPFWQFFHRVRLAAFPSEPDSRRKLLWTNLIKFVAMDSGSILWRPYCEKALALQDDVLVTELQIFKPDICLFLTGPYYDPILERYFPGIRFDDLNLPRRQFAKLAHPSLPNRSYRTYHPNALRKMKLWDTVFDALCNELSWNNLT